MYAFLFIMARVAFSGDFKRFLERTAKIQAGLLICVYSLSYAPALLNLNLYERNGDAVGRQRAAVVFSDPDRVGERRNAVSLGQAAGQAADRAGDQPQPDVGRISWGRGQRDVVGGGVVVGDAVRAVGGGANGR